MPAFEDETVSFTDAEQQQMLDSLEDAEKRGAHAYWSTLLKISWMSGFTIPLPSVPGYSVGFPLIGFRCLN